jgi:hypothetical protein
MKIFKSICAVLLSFDIAPIVMVGSSKIDVSSFIEDFTDETVRFLKKTKKSKAPVPKKNKHSKSPNKSSCFTNAQSAEFISALTASVISGATTIELFICDGDKIDIPSPIILTYPESQRRLIEDFKKEVRIGCSKISKAPCKVMYTGEKPVDSVIEIKQSSHFFHVDIPTPMELLSKTAAVGNFIEVNGEYEVKIDTIKVDKKIGGIIRNKQVQCYTSPVYAPVAPQPAPAPFVST